MAPADLVLSRGNASYRERFREVLKWCRLADREQKRILSRYRKGEKVYLYELSETTNWVGGVASVLDEWMFFEHDDFSRIEIGRVDFRSEELRIDY